MSNPLLSSYLQACHAFKSASGLTSFQRCLSIIVPSAGLTFTTFERIFRSNWWARTHQWVSQTLFRVKRRVWEEYSKDFGDVVCLLSYLICLVVQGKQQGYLTEKRSHRLCTLKCGGRLWACVNIAWEAHCSAHTVPFYMLDTVHVGEQLLWLVPFLIWVDSKCRALRHRQEQRQLGKCDAQRCESRLFCVSSLQCIQMCLTSTAAHLVAPLCHVSASNKLILSRLLTSTNYLSKASMGWPFQGMQSSHSWITEKEQYVQ